MTVPTRGLLHTFRIIGRPGTTHPQKALSGNSRYEGFGLSRAGAGFVGNICRESGCISTCVRCGCFTRADFIGASSSSRRFSARLDFCNPLSNQFTASPRTNASSLKHLCERGDFELEYANSALVRGANHNYLPLCGPDAASTRHERHGSSIRHGQFVDGISSQDDCQLSTCPEKIGCMTGCGPNIAVIHCVLGQSTVTKLKMIAV